jgi:arylsulfatase A
MCENIDDNVGRVLAHLDAQRLADNTIVLFLTDNGGTAGVKTYNAGMRGGKTSVHEGGSRVPLFVRWPAAKWPPHVARPIVSHIDILPTLMDLCDLKTPVGPELDGVSLRPLLENSDSSLWPERTLYTHNPIDESNKFPGAVRTQRYRLVREIQGPAGGSSAQANDASATAWQLYDMQLDPGQKNDIAAGNPEVVRELSQRYDAWFADISQDGLQRFPLPVGVSQHNPVELHAPQAYFDKPLYFANGPGFANDWLTGWADVKSRVWFEIDVMNSGEYDVELAFGCPVEDAGSSVSISVGDSRLQTVIPAAPAAEIPLPHRDEKGKSRYRNRQWSSLELGTVTLSKGPAKLTIEPLDLRGKQIMDFKHLRLRLR